MSSVNAVSIATPVRIAAAASMAAPVSIAAPVSVAAPVSNPARNLPGPLPVPNMNSFLDLYAQPSYPTVATASAGNNSSNVIYSTAFQQTTTHTPGLYNLAFSTPNVRSDSPYLLSQSVANNSSNLSTNQDVACNVPQNICEKIIKSEYIDLATL